MSYRRRHRWFRRMALGLAFASVLAAGRVSVAAAKFDEGTSGSRYVAAGGWSGQVDMESGIPLSAGIPHGDEQFLDSQAVQVIPYLSHGMLTEAEARAASLATAEAIHDPYLTDLFVRPGESLGGPDGEAIAFANAIEAQSLATAETIHDPYVSPGVLGEAVKTNVADVKFVPPVISYLSHGMTADDVAGLRPDDRGDRFAHSDVPAPVEVSSSGSTIEWNEALTVGIGALVLALALGLALGYLRRPRLAGL